MRRCWPTRVSPGSPRQAPRRNRRRGRPIPNRRWRQVWCAWRSSRSDYTFYLRPRDRDAIVDRGDTRNRPSGALRLLALDPALDLAAQDYAVVLDGYANSARLQLRVALESGAQAGLHVGGIDARTDLNRVDHAVNAAQSAQIAFGFVALVTPFDDAGKRDNAALDLDRKRAWWNQHVPFEQLDRSLCDLVVGRLLVRGQVNVEFLRNGLDPFHPAHRALGRESLGDAADVAAQGDDAAFCRDADTGRIDAGIEGQLVEHALLQLKVVA